MDPLTRHGGVRSRRTFLLFLIAPLIAIGAQSAPLDPVAQQLFHDIMSPYCPGLTLAVCPSEGAQLLKDTIRARLAVGRSADEVMAELEGRYGAGIRARPRARGIGLVAWLGPILPLLLGVILLTLWVRRATRRRSIAATGSERLAIAEADRIRLEQALREDR